MLHFFAGPQSKPQQPHDVEPITIQQQQPPAPPTHSFEDESSLYVVDQEVSQVFEAEAKANAGNKSELNEASAYQWSSDITSQHHVGHLASSNIVVRERTIKLPETHIFTPVKGSSPVAREVTSRDTSPAPDEQYFPKGSIVVKEYHDVEYSLEPKKRVDSDADFDDFQSAQPATVKTNQPLVPLNLLEPQKVENAANEIKWPEPGNITQSIGNELDFLEAPKPPATVVPKVNLTLPLAPSATSSVVSSKKKEPEFAKPVIGTSPTEQNGKLGGDDDDFNDFQAAPPRAQAPKKVQANDPITLSPARLVANIAQQTNQSSAWISSFDDDEVSRFEAAFPKCKTEKKSTQKSGDDDDWSDFVAATQPFASQPPSMISSQTMMNMSKVSNGDADDWSDFVSVQPSISKIPSSRSSSAISSQFQSKPNFSSWNQPLAKPYVNHTTSFLTNDSRNQSQQFTSSNYPSQPSMTITKNFSYNFNNPELNHTTGASRNHHQQQQQRPNGISTILPELDFAMPKHLINLPRGGSLDPGKK